MTSLLMVVIVREAARLLLEGMPKSGLRILNIGFGIGMVCIDTSTSSTQPLSQPPPFIQIDKYFQDAQPAVHVIIEGHPTCLGWMRHTGWYDRPGVRVLEGRWQDFLPPKFDNTSGRSLAPPSSAERQPNTDGAGLLDIGKFDVVYFDTFEEGYRGHFAFIRHVPRLLRGPSSRFSFFHGHAAKNETAYNVRYNTFIDPPVFFFFRLMNFYLEKLAKNALSPRSNT